nr:Rieske 2Fe-2S domain-containing protein [Halarchaeum solikamskense]
MGLRQSEHHHGPPDAGRRAAKGHPRAERLGGVRPVSDGEIEVGAADAFADGDVEIIEVGRVEVGVIKADGEFYALRNQCPHDGGPACEGPVEKRLVGEWGGPGERVEQRYGDDSIVSCPWHGWSFYLETGEHIGDDSYVVPSYDVVVRDGVVYVQTD